MSAPLEMPSLHSAVTLAGPSPERKALLSRRIRWFVAATITYNVIEAIIALTEGARVSSVSADRVRPGLGDRGVLRGGGRVAVRRA